MDDLLTWEVEVEEEEDDEGVLLLEGGTTLEGVVVVVEAAAVEVVVLGTFMVARRRFRVVLNWTPAVVTAFPDDSFVSSGSIRVVLVGLAFVASGGVVTGATAGMLLIMSWLLFFSGYPCDDKTIVEAVDAVVCEGLGRFRCLVVDIIWCCCCFCCNCCCCLDRSTKDDDDDEADEDFDRMGTTTGVGRLMDRGTSSDDDK